ncbi:uncharacterized protein LOC144663094 [Oculina patagonica]
MGASVSSGKITEEDRVKRQNLQNELRKMQNSLHVTSASHYISTEHYREWDMRLQYASIFTGTLGTTASVASKLGWKMLVSKNPRLAPILVATSTTSLLFTALVNLPQIQNTPANLYQAHFRSGIECQYLERQVKFFTETEVWDSKVAWETLAAKYEKFLKDKKEVNSKIKSENWAYRKALKKIEDREREKQAKARSTAEQEAHPVSSN